MLLCRLDITLLIVREANALEDGLFRRRESRECLTAEARSSCPADVASRSCLVGISLFAAFEPDRGLGPSHPNR
jgi:hypothetical protein